jgi:hypothetical protein
MHLPFAISIGVLSLAQAAVVALPATRAWPISERLASGWWAVVLPGSVIVVIAAIALDPGIADLLTYLALAAVPPLAAIALAAVIRGARPQLAIAALPLLAIACGLFGSLPAEASALALSALACVTLGSLIADAVPPRWIRFGIYAMALVDAFLVGANLLQGPDNVLNAAAPGAGLPQLQFAQFGSAVIGFGDLFIAAVLGALLAPDPARQRQAAGVAALIALAFDLLFFFVSELPATVPIALALAVLEISDRRRAPATTPKLTPATTPQAESP